MGAASTGVQAEDALACPNAQYKCGQQTAKDLSCSSYMESCGCNTWSSDCKTATNHGAVWDLGGSTACQGAPSSVNATMYCNYEGAN